MDKEGKDQSYTLLKWNEKYGHEAKFVVQDNSTGQHSVFTPGRTQDLVWTKTNLAEMPEIAEWSDFGNETVSNLDDIAF